MKIEDCGSLGKLSARATDGLAVLAEALRADAPELEIAIVLRTKEGQAIACGRKVEGKEAVLEQISVAQKLFRAAGESCGRMLYESPAAPAEVMRESLEIEMRSQEAAKSWSASKCTHPGCQVKDAAVGMATALRILQEIGAPADALRDLQNMVKETCRRTHLKILERSARGSA